MEYDIAFSVGPRCRPAYYLEKHGLRVCAYPLDWLVCSLDIFRYNFAFASNRI